MAIEESNTYIALNIILHFIRKVKFDLYYHLLIAIPFVHIQVL